MLCGLETPSTAANTDWVPALLPTFRLTPEKSAEGKGIHSIFPCTFLETGNPNPLSPNSIRVWANSVNIYYIIVSYDHMHFSIAPRPPRLYTTFMLTLLDLEHNFANFNDHRCL